jgi:hypothetical protein
LTLIFAIFGAFAAHGQTVCTQIAQEPQLPAPPSGVYRGNSPDLYLWPGNGPRDMAPGAVRSTNAGFGPGLDRGALRRRADGAWEYLEFGGWAPWQPSIRMHQVAASAFRRYGPGWSYGPSWGGHTEHWSYALELCGVSLAPDSMAALDLEHSNSLYRRLQAEWMARFNPSPAPTSAPPQPAPTPAPAPSPAPTPAPPTPTPQPGPTNCQAIASARVAAWEPVLNAIRQSSLGKQVFREVTPEILRAAFQADCEAGGAR